MKRVDQEMRTIVSEHINDGKFNEYFDSNIDIENTKKLKEIISIMGWPTISKVGRVVSNAAWLLAQHADHDIEFQKEYLNKMLEFSSDEVNLRNIAYLDDRIKTKENIPQLYGTQVIIKEDGTAEPFPIYDAENVNKRRVEKGMETIEEYLNTFE